MMISNTTPEYLEIFYKIFCHWRSTLRNHINKIMYGPQEQRVAMLINRLRVQQNGLPPRCDWILASDLPLIGRIVADWPSNLYSVLFDLVKNSPDTCEIELKKLEYFQELPLLKDFYCDINSMWRLPFAGPTKAKKNANGDLLKRYMLQQKNQLDSPC